MTRGRTSLAVTQPCRNPTPITKTRWKAGEFVVPEVYPMVPALKAYPPQQIALTRVLNIVMD